MADDILPPDTADDEPSYKVGYGKPPVHSQFKKGNKHGKGRPRASRNINTIIRDVAGERILAKINGQMRKVSRLELSTRQLANKASAGDLKAIVQFVALFERYSPPQNDDPIPEDETAYDLETLRHHFMMQGEADDE